MTTRLIIGPTRTKFSGSAHVFAVSLMSGNTCNKRALVMKNLITIGVFSLIQYVTSSVIKCN